MVLVGECTRLERGGIGVGRMGAPPRAEPFCAIEVADKRRLLSALLCCLVVGRRVEVVEVYE